MAADPLHGGRYRIVAAQGRDRRPEARRQLRRVPDGIGYQLVSRDDLRPLPEGGLEVSQ
jgi:hypothetical protein